jgi:hypothetical protein
MLDGPQPCLLWFLGKQDSVPEKVVVRMVLGLLIFAAVLVVFEALAYRFGTTSSDGDDWLTHRPA